VSGSISGALIQLPSHDAKGAGDVTIGGSSGYTISASSLSQFTLNYDTIQGADHDTIIGGSYDTITGGARDTIIGGDHDSITGGPHDTIIGGAYDTIQGGIHDTITFGATESTVDGAVKWGSDSDHLDTLYGGGHHGLGNHDTIIAAAGDTIIGGKHPGSDTISAHGGNETVTGTGAHETVSGFDTVTGPGHDTISFSGESASSIQKVIAAQELKDGNTTLHLPDGSSITLIGITKVDTSFFH